MYLAIVAHIIEKPSRKKMTALLQLGLCVKRMDFRDLRFRVVVVCCWGA